MKTLITFLITLLFVPSTLLQAAPRALKNPDALYLSDREKISIYCDKRMYLDKDQFMVGPQVYAPEQASFVIKSVGGYASYHLNHHPDRNSIAGLGAALVIAACVLTPMLVPKADGTNHSSSGAGMIGGPYIGWSPNGQAVIVMLGVMVAGLGCTTLGLTRINSHKDVAHTVKAYNVELRRELGIPEPELLGKKLNMNYQMNQVMQASLVCALNKPTDAELEGFELNIEQVRLAQKILAKSDWPLLEMKARGLYSFFELGDGFYTGQMPSWVELVNKTGAGYPDVQRPFRWDRLERQYLGLALEHVWKEQACMNTFKKRAWARKKAKAALKQLESFNFPLHAIGADPDLFGPTEDIESEMNAELAPHKNRHKF
jgi:hypothetical protein